MFEPETPVSTQVRVTVPCVHPVVRPTLLSDWPTAEGLSPTIENWPAITSDPLFTPVVWAMPPRVNETPLSPSLKFTSLNRHLRPRGQPLAWRKNDGSAISVPMCWAGTWSRGWKYWVPSTDPWLSLQCAAVTNPATPPRTAL